MELYEIATAEPMAGWSSCGVLVEVASRCLVFMLAGAGGELVFGWLWFGQVVEWTAQDAGSEWLALGEETVVELMVVLSPFAGRVGELAAV